MGTAPQSAAQTPTPAERLDAGEKALLTYAESTYLVEQGSALLDKARRALAATPSNDLEARSALLQFECLIRRAEKSNTEGAAVARAILLSDLVWFVFLCAAAVFGTRAHTWLEGSVGADLWRIVVLASISGGMGGLTQTVFGLRKHLVQRDFDPAMRYWYFAKPFMGLVLGPIIVLVFLSGLLALGDLGVGEQSNADSGAPSLLSPVRLAFVICLSFVAGYSERFWAQLLDQVLDVLLRRDAKRESES